MDFFFREMDPVSAWTYNIEDQIRVPPPVSNAMALYKSCRI